MPDEDFKDNLLRMIAAELHLLVAMTTAREMFAKSYFSLGVQERISIDQTVFGMVSSNYQAITPESLAAQKSQQPVGFQPAEKGKV